MMRPLFVEKLALTAVLCGALMTAPTQIRAQVNTAQQQAVIRRPIPDVARNRTANFARTELFFGTAKPSGVVTEEEFKAFLDQEVTPRFPDGLTVIKGDGQFTGADGVLVKEQSFVLILLYPTDTAKESNRKIEGIRQFYMAQFQQESVLRVDDPFGVWVRF